MHTCLVTGAAGFIGSNFVRLLLDRRPDLSIVALDALTYAGNLANLAACEASDRYRFVRADIGDVQALTPLFERGVDFVVNFAAESHVDRSIHGAAAFVATNVTGTQNLLDLSRQHRVRRYVQISTDEVYGSLGPEGTFSEVSPIAPSSPYSASKAAADLLVHAAHETFGLDTVITRCSNNYGPYQFPEKLIPLFVTNLLAGEQVPLYGDGLNVRDWIHVRDHCEAVLLVMERAAPGAVYNIGGDCEKTNIEIAKTILEYLGHGESMIHYVKDRPGHDRRYAMDFTRLTADLGWRPSVAFGDGMKETIDWYVANERWWRPIKSGDYLHYYKKQYGTGGVVGVDS